MYPSKPQLSQVVLVKQQPCGDTTRLYSAWTQVELRPYEHHCYLLFLTSGSVDSHLSLFTNNSCSYTEQGATATQLVCRVWQGFLSVDYDSCCQFWRTVGFRKHWVFCPFLPHNVTYNFSVLPVLFPRSHPSSSPLVLPPVTLLVLFDPKYANTIHLIAELSQMDVCSKGDLERVRIETWNLRGGGVAGIFHETNEESTLQKKVVRDHNYQHSYNNFNFWGMFAYLARKNTSAMCCWKIHSVFLLQFVPMEWYRYCIL